MAVTKAHCGTNIQTHGVAGGEGVAQDPTVAQIIAWALFTDALATADKSLRAFAAQPCPKKTCGKKVPANPLPVYSDFNFTLRWDPGAPAVPAGGGKPAKPGRPHAWICVISAKGTVTFECEEEEDVQP